MALGTRVQFEQTSDTRSFGALNILSERLSETIDRGVKYLLSLQASEGYWMGELEADTTLESDYIFYLNVINRAQQDRIHKPTNSSKLRGASRNSEAWKRRIPTRGFISPLWARSDGTWFPRSRRS